MSDDRPNESSTFADEHDATLTQAAGQLIRDIYAGELAQVGGMSMLVEGTHEMFRNVWNHNVPYAVAQGAVALLGFNLYSTGTELFPKAVDALTKLCEISGYTAAKLSNVTTEQVDLALPVQKRPTDAMLQALQVKPEKLMMRLALLAAMAGAGLPDVAQSPNGEAIALLSGIALMSLLTHRQLRSAVNASNEAALNSGLVAAGVTDQQKDNDPVVGRPRITIRRVFTFQ